MAYTHTISKDWDLDYLLDKAGIVNLYSTSIEEDTLTIDYIGTSVQYNAMLAAIENYPVSYAEDVLKPKLIDQAAANRWDAQQYMIYNGVRMECDDVTIGRITATVVLMDADPDSPQTRLWKVAGDNPTWLTLDRAALVTMGSAIAGHMQDCFDVEYNLLNQISAATTIDELAAIDVDADWPGHEPAEEPVEEEPVEEEPVDPETDPDA